jgi:FKBP-type peptidyl-prolyl cis-trans isomerase
MTAATKTKKPASKTTAEVAASDAETLKLADDITAERAKAPAKPKKPAKPEWSAKAKARLAYVNKTEGKLTVSQIRAGAGDSWDRQCPIACAAWPQPG